MLSTEDSTMVSYEVFETAMVNFAVLIFDLCQSAHLLVMMEQFSHRQDI